MTLFLGLIAPWATAQLAGIEIKTEQKQIPVLKYKTNNPVLRIKIETTQESTLKALRVSTQGTDDLNDISKVRLFYSGADSLFSEKQPYARETSPKPELLFRQALELNVGTHYFWVSYQVGDEAGLLHKVDASLIGATFRQGNIQVPADEASTQLRLGLALRQHRQDGVNTHRIPGLTTSENGTLLAVYDARRDGGRDLQGDIDIGLNRSTDRGNTWQPMQVVLDKGTWGGLPEKFNGVSDASILADTATGTIYVAGLWMHGVLNKDGLWIEGLTAESDAWQHQWHNRGSQPGLGIKETSQFLITKSTDNGLTWSEPINLTQMAKRKEWWLWAPAPGRGIVMDDGTLVFPTQGRGATGETFSNITYSQDQGKSWTTSEPAYSNTTECAVVQLSDGRLMLNMRDNRNRDNKAATNGRAVFTTRNMGASWEQHPTHHGALPEPTCMASLHKHPYDNGTKSVLLFSNPNSKYQREHITVKVSFDDGMSWPEENWMLLDEGRGRGYSCLTSIDENTIGIVYESSQADLVFQQIVLSELIER
ncbi:exo-alpha-sialidase [Persicitalea sp.]|uniref:exo-alpha-sialidase n=1 Tax=Persicitalea sp. TaxID=3100273 RepID=UPI003593F0FA